jgi:hypothetical protein
MPEQNETKVLFGAEFDNEGMKQGVDELLSTLAKAQEAQELLKQSIKETTDEMKKNRKEAEKLEKQLSTTIDPKMVDDQTKKLHKLNEEYDDLVQQNADLAVANKKVTETVKVFNKENAKTAKQHNEVSKAISKFTSVNAIAADGIKKVGNYAKDAAFGFVAGFAGGIVGAVVPALIQWVSAMVETTEEITKLQKQKEILNGVFTEASKAVGDDVAKLEVYKNKLNDTNISAADRVKIAKEYNKTADEQNKIDLTQIDNLDLINARLDEQNRLLIKRAVSLAATNKLNESATRLVDTELKLQEGLKKAGLTEDQVQSGIGIQAVGARSLAIRNQMNAAERAALDASNALSILKLARNTARDEMAEMLKLLSPLITPEGLTTQDKSAPKQIENVFLQKLAELKARLAQSMAASFQSEPLIRKQFSEQLNKEFFDIGKLLKDKQLTAPQADILKGLLQQINQIDLSKALNEFRDKQKAAIQKINDDITQLMIEEQTKRIVGIRDEFAKEQAQIDLTYQQALEAIERSQRELIKKIDADAKALSLDPAVVARKKAIANFFYGGLLDEAERAKNNAQLDLAFKQFQKTLELAKAPFESQILKDNEGATRLIRQQVGLFLEGKITYEKYQKNLTAIIKNESKERRRVQLDELEEQERLIQTQLDLTTDPAQLKQLQAQRDALRAQISALRREIATGTADDKNSDEKKRIDSFIAYVNAVHDLAKSVVSFWQQVNQAEAAALDRSIALQNKRVENAREIAEKGNAEYLELEQKRLDELERKREDNARKQLAINNALAASEAIVAAITAIAQAVKTGSPLAAIAAVAAVIGAIGASYNFVNSLQPQEANFFTGTEYVDGPAGRDKVKANLTQGERVVTKDDNKAYWKTLTAIHNHAIPPEHLNRFVEGYPNLSAPLVDFDRLSVATDGKIGADSVELLNKVDALNGTMEQVVVGLSEIGINVNLDENGFEASISKARKRRVLRTRA